MSWIHHVGALPPPNMSLPFTVSPATPSTPNGPLSSATVNVFLKPVAAAEAKAEALAHEAELLAHQAMQTHDGYPAALSKIGDATGAWRNVQRLAQKLLDADAQQSTPEKTADMAEAKIAAPGIISTAQHAIEHLFGLHQHLAADQAHKRPDLPPAAAVPSEGMGLGWAGLAIGAGIVYLVWKAVF